MSNRLQHAQSPYLLQHQDNPVDWWPWGDEAFAEAQAQDKPIFLSIGYSTCHWCHVMAHESFEDAEVARLMNAAFINIKVDREERPDVDALYMAVCQMLTGSGGWPLTLLLTPDKQPFFAGTYLPKHTRHGRLGMLEFVPRIQAAWQQRRAEVTATAGEITGALREAAAHGGGADALDPDALHLAFGRLRQRFDARHGGFGTAPKFPSPHTLLFLLRTWKRTGDDEALHMVETTLQQMRLGGLFDHVGYGFHRYATDAEWRVPHFEKMLYDQAMLVLAYVEAFQATQRPVFATTAREILTYVLRDLTAPEGGFYSAEDADSEGREGLFYLWTRDELLEVLPPDLADLVVRLYSVEAEGNFEEEATRQRTGENILFLTAPMDDHAAPLGLEPAALRARMEEARALLFAHREGRIHPGKDDKVLADWNGLMIAALATAARVLEEPAWADAATRAARFLLTTMRRPDGRLWHRYRQGAAGLPASIDDYAFLVWGLLELYQTTFDVSWLREALTLNDLALRHFWDEAHGAFFFTPDDGEPLLVRQKEAYDGAIPSGNSVAMLNLLRLGRLTGRPDLEERSEAVGRFFAEAVRQQPTGFTAMLQALDFTVGPSFEVVVAGAAGAADTEAMLRAVQTPYVPNKVVLHRPAEAAGEELAALAPYAEAQHAVGGRATAYVCRQYQCEQPTTDPAVVPALLGASEKS